MSLFNTDIHKLKKYEKETISNFEKLLEEINSTNEECSKEQIKNILKKNLMYTPLALEEIIENAIFFNESEEKIIGYLTSIRAEMVPFIPYNLTRTNLNYVGTELTGGTIIIHGDAGNYIGKYMKKGRIIIKGNAGNYVGKRMCGGTIEIKGHANYWIGESMHGGKIIIHGKIGCVGTKVHGKIYQIKKILHFFNKKERIR